MGSHLPTEFRIYLNRKEALTYMQIERGPSAVLPQTPGPDDDGEEQGLDGKKRLPNIYLTDTYDNENGDLHPM